RGHSPRASGGSEACAHAWQWSRWNSRCQRRTVAQSTCSRLPSERRTMSQARRRRSDHFSSISMDRGYAAVCLWSCGCPSWASQGRCDGGQAFKNSPPGRLARRLLLVGVPVLAEDFHLLEVVAVAADVAQAAEAGAGEGGLRAVVPGERVQVHPVEVFGLEEV